MGRKRGGNEESNLSSFVKLMWVYVFIYFPCKLFNTIHWLGCPCAINELVSHIFTGTSTSGKEYWQPRQALLALPWAWPWPKRLQGTLVGCIQVGTVGFSSKVKICFLQEDEQQVLVVEGMIHTHQWPNHCPEALLYLQFHGTLELLSCNQVQVVRPVFYPNSLLLVRGSQFFPRS